MFKVSGILLSHVSFPLRPRIVGFHVCPQPLRVDASEVGLAEVDCPLKSFYTIEKERSTISKAEYAHGLTSWRIIRSTSAVAIRNSGPGRKQSLPSHVEAQYSSKVLCRAHLHLRLCDPVPSRSIQATMMSGPAPSTSDSRVIGIRRLRIFQRKPACPHGFIIVGW